MIDRSIEKRENKKVCVFIFFFGIEREKMDIFELREEEVDWKWEVLSSDSDTHNRRRENRKSEFDWIFIVNKI